MLVDWAGGEPRAPLCGGIVTCSICNRRWASLALLGFAWAISENRRAVAWKSAGIALAGDARHRGAAAENTRRSRSALPSSTALSMPSARRPRPAHPFVFGYVGGGTLPFELKIPGRRILAGLPGAADRAGDERARPRCCSTGASCRRSCAAFPGYWSARWASAAPSACPPPPISSSAWSKSPLFIRPYLAKLSRGELFMVMTGGMAGIAGTVFVLYATILRNVIPDVAGHILVASILGAPAALLISQLMVPMPARRAHRYRPGRDRPRRRLHHGCDLQGHRRRSRTSAQHHRHDDRAGGAGASRQRRS